MTDQKLTVTICKGIPGSGKSTWAKKVCAESEGKIKRVNKDDLRAMVDTGKHSAKREKFVLELRDTIIRHSLSSGLSVIVDDTNLHDKHEIAIRDIVAKEFPDVDVVINDSFLQVPIMTCIDRDKKRSGKAQVGFKVILRMAKQAGICTKGINAWKLAKCDNDREYKEYNPKLIDCVICDLDGTLSLMHGNRTPYEAAKCISDKLNVPVGRMLTDYRQLGVKILLFSGRSDAGLESTKQWLVNNGVIYDELVMREDGDFRNDGIIKEEMFNAHVKDKYNVRFVLDDRDMVVKKWRSMGLLTLQVFEGDF
jgi:predicted kinase